MIRVYTKNKELYMDADPKTNLVYICESKGNKLLEIISIGELKTYLELKK